MDDEGTVGKSGQSPAGQSPAGKSGQGSTGQGTPTKPHFSPEEERAEKLIRETLMRRKREVNKK